MLCILLHAILTLFVRDKWIFEINLYTNCTTLTIKWRTNILLGENTTDTNLLTWDSWDSFYSNTALFVIFSSQYCILPTTSWTKCERKECYSIQDCFKSDGNWVEHEFFDFAIVSSESSNITIYIWKHLSVYIHTLAERAGSQTTDNDAKVKQLINKVTHRTQS